MLDKFNGEKTSLNNMLQYKVLFHAIIEIKMQVVGM